MATNTYEAIATQTVGSAVSSVTFSSIPSTYTDLVVVVNGRTARATTGDQILAYFNSDNSTSNYSWTYLIGNGSSAASGRVGTGSYYAMIGTIAGNSATSGEVGTAIAHIQNYSNTTTKKTILVRGNGASSETQAAVSLWQGTAAISSITFSAITGANILAGTTISIYGVTAATALAAKATGGTIYYGADGYVYHKFTSSGTFTPTQSLTVDAMVLAGGGGGGSTYGQSAGGGAGGLLSLASQAVTATGYTVTVGGAGSYNSTMNGPNGTNGNDSSFGSLGTALGGGGGGSYRNNGAAASVGSSGGSGGGGGAVSSGGSGGAGGSGVSGQGYAGGAGYGSSTWGGGGGGGAGGAGTNAVGGSTGGYYLGGNGGVGSSAFSTWGAITSSGQNVSGTYYFGGGGGGDETDGTTAGLDGYGNGAANTGGGGSRDAQSGIVIIRYLG